MGLFALPARTEVSDIYPNPSNLIARIGMGRLWDFIISLLGADGSKSAMLAASKILDPAALYNLSLVPTVATNALTMTVKSGDGATDLAVDNAGTVGQRSATATSGTSNIRNITANISLVISSGSTLGHVSATPAYIYWYLIDNAGAQELAASSKDFGMFGIVSTTAEGGVGAADSATVMYSGTARSNVPYRFIGRTTDSQTAAGTWAAVPTLVELRAAGIPTTTGVDRIEGKLTFTSGMPVPVADVSNVTTIYFTPYRGNVFSVYNGSQWIDRTFTEISAALPSGTTWPYDAFLYDNAGTLAMEFVPWSSDTARVTALALQDGKLVKNGSATRRYVGSWKPSALGASSDSLADRLLWNYYNRVSRFMSYVRSGSWSNSSPVWRQAAGSSSSKLNFMIGVSEDHVEASIVASARSTAVASEWQTVAIGLDSTTPSALCTNSLSDSSPVANNTITLSAQWAGQVAAGYHGLYWLESAAGVGTTTWQGSSARGSSGIQGILRG